MQVDSFGKTFAMEEAVKWAYKMPQRVENTVLLSPACAKVLDLFKNYEDRGDQFKNCVKKKP